METIRMRSCIVLGAVIFIHSLFVPLCGHSKSSYHSQERYHVSNARYVVSGDVSEILIDVFDAEGTCGETEQVVLTSTNSIEYSFNDQGYLKQHIVYDGSNNAISEKYYKYNEDEKLASIDYPHIGDDGIRDIFTYDDENRLIEKQKQGVRYETDTYIERINLGQWIFSYDEYGNMTERTRIDAPAPQSTFLKYDNRGNVIEKQFYNDLNYQGSRIFTYDENDQLIEDKRISPDNQVSWKQVNMYNEVGQLETAERSISRPWKRKHKYDAEGNKIETRRYENGVLKTKHISEYDESGNKVKVIRYDANEEISGYSTYEFDDYGNWVRAISCEGEEITRVIDREISYYE